MSERFIIIAPKDENTIIVNDGEPHEQQSWGLKYYSLEDFNECLEILEDVIVQSCTDESVKEASTPRLDSMALSSYADALRFLAKHGRVTIVSEYGKRVIASLNHEKKG